MSKNDLGPRALEQIATEFLDTAHDAPSYRTRVHARKGELAATDGRILIHISDPRIEASDGSRAEVLGFRLPETVAVADAAWIRGPLKEAVLPRMVDVRKRLPKMQETFANEAERGMTRHWCPCCGRKFWEDEDGDFYDPDVYLKENQPSELSVGGDVLIRIPAGGPPSPIVAAYYLDKAVCAALILGGDVVLRVNEIEVVFEGDGWFVCIMAKRYFGFDVSIDVPAGKGGAE